MGVNIRVSSFPEPWKLKISSGLVNRRLNNLFSRHMPLFFITLLPFIIISAIITVILQRKHLLIALLAFEGIILGLIALYIFTSPPSDIFISIILLTMGACEASLGLACLVNITRSYGNDHLNSICLSKC